MAVPTRATWVHRASLLTVGWLVLLGPAAASDHPATMGVLPAAPGPPALNFFTLTPCRVVDTRLAGGPLVAGIERTFTFAGTCGIPSTAVAVSINVAVAQATTAGNVRLYPAGSAVPMSSTINYAAAQTRANNAVVGLSAAGELAAQCQPAGSADLIVDVNGYFEIGCPTPTQSCYSGPGGTAGAGICSLGTRYCIDGSYGPCIGEVTPSGESCNGLDDDCNGAIDDGLGTITCGVGACQQTAPACAGGNPGTCTPGTPTAEICGDGIDNNCNGLIDEGCACAYVAPFGSDVTGTGSAALPFRTISWAISKAGTGGLPNLVCVAAGSTCAGTPTTSDYLEAVTMRNGVHVYGGYAPTGATWPRAAGCVTRIVDQNPRGVYFDATVTAATILDGFTILGQNGPTTAAVTVEGSTGAVVSNDTVVGGNGTTSYGVNVIDSAGTPATPTISNNAITGGNGTALAVGVRSLNSAPVIQANCSSFDASGRCSAPCFTGTRFVAGRATGGTGAESYGVRLETSPGAVVDQNNICTNGNSTTDAAGVRLSGDATGVVIRANNIYGAFGQQNAVGVWADPCAGASPWVVSNYRIAATSTTSGAHADGIRALGSCDVRIDHNLQVIAGLESANAATNAVFCARDAVSGVASRCTILGNGTILGSGAGFPPTSTGVRCDEGACAIIRNNALISGRGGQIAVGVVLGRTGTLVDANVIGAGCASIEGIGLLSNDSFARVQNNQILGAAAGIGCTAPASYAAKVVLGAGANEIDLDSNDLFAEGFAGACTSRGIAFDISGSPPLGPRGLVRNNIVLAGNCNQTFDVDEMSFQADPRLLENNDLWQNAAVTALYRDENSTNLTSITAVNALSDLAASGNISADPLYTSGHLSPGSSCRNAGVATGAPNHDFEGDPRPQESLFDIGRDEYKP